MLTRSRVNQSFGPKSFAILVGRRRLAAFSHCLLSETSTSVLQSSLLFTNSREGSDAGDYDQTIELPSRLRSIIQCNSQGRSEQPDKLTEPREGWRFGWSAAFWSFHIKDGDLHDIMIDRRVKLRQRPMCENLYSFMSTTLANPASHCHASLPRAPPVL